MILAILIAILVLVLFAWMLGEPQGSVRSMEAKCGIFFLLSLGGAVFVPGFPHLPAWIIGLVGLVIVLPHRLPWLHRLVARYAYKRMRPKAPSLSETERIAIEAGDLSWERQLFIGEYAGPMLEEAPRKHLSPAEKKFLNNEVNELCRLSRPAEIERNKGLSTAALDYIKKKRFWGMIIPRAQGGLGFSANGHAAVITKLASRSSALAVTVMVPNSLGPGELLLRYGTAEQKKHYLPRLAKGEEIPCFALTSEVVGSDASGLEDYGIVCRRTIAGKKVLGFRLCWRKRYISLAPIATLIGLAFKAYDPDGLLAPVTKSRRKSPYQKDLGITCALIPRDTKGVSIGRRHNPMDLRFHNGPIEGDDVFIPMDFVIGGQKMVGQGWRMLMECLAMGRGISLPSLADAGSQLAAWTSIAYTNIREQFGLPVARFEGVAKSLAELALNAYAVKAVRSAAVDMVDAGHRPAIASAMAKLFATERLRDSVGYAMDVHGGKAIMKGDKNYLEELYRSVPIGITVEGANILTRNMIIFGQGIMRCHPFLRAEAEALAAEDEESFAQLLWQHYIHIIQIESRAWGGSWTAGFLFDYPRGNLKSHHRRLALLSTQFAYCTEIAVFVFGGRLKRREAVSALFADAWMNIFAAVAVCRKFIQDGEPAAQTALVKNTLTQLESQAQYALLQTLRNFPRLLRPLLRFLVFPLGHSYRPPSDQDLLHLAEQLSSPVDLTTELATDIYKGRGDPLADIEDAFVLNHRAIGLRQRIKKAGYRKDPYQKTENFLASLVKQKVLTAAERSLWLKAHHAVRKVIAVDDFDAV